MDFYLSLTELVTSTGLITTFPGKDGGEHVALRPPLTDHVNLGKPLPTLGFYMCKKGKYHLAPRITVRIIYTVYRIPINVKVLDAK